MTVAELIKELKGYPQDKDVEYLLYGDMQGSIIDIVVYDEPSDKVFLTEE